MERSRERRQFTRSSSRFSASLRASRRSQSKSCGYHTVVQTIWVAIGKRLLDLSAYRSCVGASGLQVSTGHTRRNNSAFRAQSRFDALDQPLSERRHGVAANGEGANNIYTAPLPPLAPERRAGTPWLCH